MSASNLAFLQQKERSEANRFAADDREREIGRQKVADEQNVEDRRTASNDRAREIGREGVADARQKILFERETSLFEQQQKFLNDEVALKKFGRRANQAMALLHSTGGQVFQPLLDIYRDIPDGGKFHQFKRNDDGTFDYDIEWQGQRYRKSGATYDEVGKMAMAITNPVDYLQSSGASAQAQKEHENKMEVERLKILGKSSSGSGSSAQKDRLSWRKQFVDEYNKLIEAEITNGDESLKSMPDGQGGLRRMTMEEYVQKQSAQNGLGSGGAIPDPKEEGAPPVPEPDPETATLNQLRVYLAARNDSIEPGQGMMAAIELAHQLGRTDLLEKFVKTTDKGLAKEVQLAKSLLAGASGDPEEDIDAAMGNVGQGGDKGIPGKKSKKRPSKGGALKALLGGGPARSGAKAAPPRPSFTLDEKP